MRAVLIGCVAWCAGCGLVLPLDAVKPGGDAGPIDAEGVDASRLDAASFDAFADGHALVDASFAEVGLDAHEGGMSSDASTDGGPSCLDGQHVSPASSTCVPTFNLVASGARHSCAVAGEVDVYCWGENAFGALGVDSSRVRIPSPTRMALPDEVNRPVLALAAAHDTTCLIDRDGDVFCWGRNDAGWAVLDAMEPVLDVPTRVPGITLAKTLALGDGFACAIVNEWVGGLMVEAAAVRCWGSNEALQLGTMTPAGSVERGSSLLRAPTLATRFTSLAVGDRHACASTSLGSVYCWGSNERGQLGVSPTTETESEFAERDVLSGIGALDAGGDTTCGARPDGRVWCWGGEPPMRGLSPEVRDSPHLPRALGDIRAPVTVGRTFACGRAMSGATSCWGSAEFGQTGRAIAAPGAHEPHAVEHASDAIWLATRIDAGDAHACAIDELGDLACWGLDASDQLGRGRDPSSRAPHRVALPASMLTSRASSLDAHGRTTCAVMTSGEAYCWGSARGGRLGDLVREPWSPEPVRIDDGADFAGHVAQVAVGGSHTCVRTRGNALYCIGDNRRGQAGTSAVAPYPGAWREVLSTGVRAAAAGDAFTCVLVEASGITHLQCFGATDSAQAPADNDGTPMPVAVGTAQAQEPLALGGAHGCVRGKDTAGAIFQPLRCWGRNDSRQATPSVLSDPVAPPARAQILSPSGVSVSVGGPLLAAGPRHTCATHDGSTDRGLYCWGANAWAQLGVPREAFGAVRTLASDTPVAALAVGEAHTCVVTDGGSSVSCFGDNRRGQLDALGGLPFSPTRVPTILEVPSVEVGSAALVAGEHHACAIGVEGSARPVFCWGDVLDGALGNGDLGAFERAETLFVTSAEP